METSQTAAYRSRPRCIHRRFSLAGTVSRTSSLQQPNAAAAISAPAAAAISPNEMAPADTHVTALLVTGHCDLGGGVGGVQPVSAPVALAGIAEGAVRAAAMSGRDQCSPRGVSGDEGAGTKGMLDAGPSITSRP